MVRKSNKKANRIKTRRSPEFRMNTSLKALDDKSMPKGKEEPLNEIKTICNRKKRVKKCSKSIEPDTKKTVSNINQTIPPNIQSQPLDIIYCEKHNDAIIEFMCIDPEYTKELCSKCLLEHKDKIKSIFSLKQLIEEFKTKFMNEPSGYFKDRIKQTQRHSIKQLDSVSERIAQLLNQNIIKYKESLIFDDNLLTSSIARKIEFKKYFKEFEVDNVGSKASLSNYSKSTTNQTAFNVTKKGIEILKNLIRDDKTDHSNGFVVEEDILQKQLNTIIQNNIFYLQNGFCPNSLGTNVPKILHWFEWDSRNLHLFNVATHTRDLIKFIAYSRISSFSRSIMVPDGRIFLIGGEDKREGAKSECHYVDIFSSTSRKVMIARTPMQVKRYDFIICYMLGNIYALCGKGTNGNILNECECYEVDTDTWKMLNPAKKARYAGAAAALKETGRIYLFGGRGEQHNEMIADIEEYDTATNVWKIIELERPAEWKHVEVCAAVQIRRGEIIIFGGSDINVEDSKYSFIAQIDKKQIMRGSDLKKPHVFVSSPFVYGNFVYAIGNEYYVKERTIHRYDIQKEVWDILF